ncbi:COG1470 family protein [Methanolobus psychrotolerans]|uniref:COG1470 family protein n=1 Tax=Methanolobus psychrotolerans TaxID=1874706 RepID=UPI000B91B2F7|nr:hypothetical protein [Methanolobus psychrotolerans]
MNKLIIIFALTVVSVTLLTQAALAVSLGVSPHSLQFDLKDGVFQKNITIINNGNDPSGYTLYTDNEYAGWICISPSAFELSSGMTKEVSVSCIPPESASGNISLRIYAIAEPAGSDLGIGAGIRIPVTIVTGKNMDQSRISIYTSFSQHIMNYF